MKTLIIHPKDSSTDFLSDIYKDMDDVIIVNNPFIPSGVLRRLIEEHDRIIMMGHGTPGGLLGKSGFIIDHTFADLLRTKTNNVYIWCNADQFVAEYDLKGFTTGMIISEVVEAIYCGINEFEDEQVEQSNLLFANVIGEVIKGDDSKLIAESVKRNYVDPTNPIVNFNNQRIYNF